MLQRKFYSVLEEWKNSKKNECLLVRGARQIGKSFIIRRFGMDNYKSFIEINFEEKPELKNIFDGNLEVKSRKGSTSSLDSILKNADVKFGYKIMNCNLGRTEKKITMPHYMAMFL
ncbi:MAG: AAA family ATPase [Treponema sp.]|nr:AAA family ATPase [Treponema sp.]